MGRNPPVTTGLLALVTMPGVHAFPQAEGGITGKAINGEVLEKIEGQREKHDG